MEERPPSTFEKMAEIYRVAPYGETLFLWNLFWGLTTYGLGNAPISIFGLSGALISIIVVRNQFRLKSRLEKTLRVNGYQDRNFTPTLSEWCNRQTARVVTEKFGYLEQYETLCQNNPDKQKLRSVPHI